MCMFSEAVMDCIVILFKSTHDISVYYHKSCELDSHLQFGFNQLYNFQRKNIIGSCAKICNTKVRSKEHFSHIFSSFVLW
jgi:hypothetical protein